MQQMEGVLGVYLIKIETGSRIDSKIYTCHACLCNGPAMHLPKVYDFFKHSTMMDFGDGSGVYAIQIVKANPHMKATVLDLEAYARWLNNISRAMLEDNDFRLFQGRHSKWAMTYLSFAYSA